jgi:Icc-related predicted phosphoesterase
MARTAIETFHQGIQANRQSPLRHGNIVALPEKGSLVITGDLHGHNRNFERIVSFADLDAHPDRHVVLQEIIHGGPQDEYGGCLSYHVLLRAISYKLHYPEQVHIIMGNHDTAFICDTEVIKDSREMNRALHEALEREFGDPWVQVRDALRDYLFSQPLAVRTANRIWMSHSLPADRLVDQFDIAVLQRDLQLTDLQKPGGAYILTWGRRMSQPVLDRMAEQFDVDLFVLGHQPQSQGWRQAGENLLILACDHNHGHICALDLARTYTMETLVKCVIPLSAIA